MREQLEQQKLIHRMTLQKLHVLEAESVAHKKGGDMMKHKYKKARDAEKEATQLASRVLAPLERLQEELQSKIRDNPTEQARLASVLNQTQSLLEKHKYAFDWKAEIQKAEAKGSEGEKIDPWDGVHKPTPMSAFLATFAALGGLKLLEYYLHEWGLQFGFFRTGNSLLVVGAFGALSALLYGAPAAPLGKPKVTLQGFGLVVTLSMALHWSGVLCKYYTGYGLIPELEIILMPALGIAAMLYFKLPIHPPAAACVMTYAELKDPTQQWPTFMLVPVLLGVGYMLLVQVCVANTVRYLNQMKVSAEAAALAKQVEENQKDIEKGEGKDGGGGDTGPDSGKKGGVKFGGSPGGGEEKLSSSAVKRRQALQSKFASARSARRSSSGGSRAGSVCGDGASEAGSPTESIADSEFDMGSEFGDSRFSSRCSSRMSSRAGSPTMNTPSPGGPGANPPGGHSPGMIRAGGLGRWAKVKGNLGSALGKSRGVDMV